MPTVRFRQLGLVYIVLVQRRYLRLLARIISSICLIRVDRKHLPRELARTNACKQPLVQAIDRGTLRCNISWPDDRRPYIPPAGRAPAKNKTSTHACIRRGCVLLRTGGRSSHHQQYNRSISMGPAGWCTDAAYYIYACMLSNRRSVVHTIYIHVVISCNH